MALLREKQFTPQQGPLLTSGVPMTSLNAPPTESVGCLVNTFADCEDLFRVRKMKFDSETLLQLLNLQERWGEMTAETQRERSVMAASQGAVSKEVMADLEGTRTELLRAHQRIDELQYTLELERRERALLNASGGGSEGGTTRQASAEIAFLCDTLAATRAEVESLTTRLSNAEVERDAAAASFAEMKRKSEQLLQGCQKITESTHSEADAAITHLSAELKQKNHEVNVLRGQLAVIQRTLDTTRQKKEATEREAEAFRQKLHTLGQSVMRLREDYNAQSTALHEARAAAAQMSVIALSTPRAAAGVGGASARLTGKSPSPLPNCQDSQEGPSEEEPATASSLQALEAALREREDRTVAPHESHDVSQERGVVEAIEGDADKPRSASKKTKLSAPKSGSKPHKAQNGSALPIEASLQEEYAELHECFLMLAPLVPGAVTARDVTKGLCSGIEQVTQRADSLEKDVRRKTVSLQAQRKSLQEAQQKIADLEKRIQHHAATDRRLEDREKEVARLTTKVTSLHNESETERQQQSKLIEQLRGEVAALKTELEARMEEIGEGKELMLSLLRGEGDDVENASQSGLLTERSDGA